MLCTNCQSNSAQFHYKQIVGGNKTELHLCPACAQALGFTGVSDSFFDIGSILSDFISQPKHTALLKENVRCEKCSTTYDEFKKTGLAGCDKCYEAFSAIIENSLSQIQPATTHKGKTKGVDCIKEETPEVKDKLSELKEELKKAITEERYEDAARLRDEIKKEEGNIDG